MRFATGPHPPFVSTAAEREIRKGMQRQKICGGRRILTGVEHFAALRSHIATIALAAIG